MKRIICLLLAAIFLASTFTAASSMGEEKKGKLSTFEKQLDDSNDKDKPPPSTSSLSASDAAAEGIIEILMAFFLMGLSQTAYEGYAGLHRELKEEWSPALPTIRIEPSYQYVAGGLHSFSGRIEAGYLILGIDGEYSRYFEKSPRDSLNLWNAHLLLRTLFSRHFGMNLALGARGLRGGQHRVGPDFGLPFYIIFTKHFILDVGPYISTVSGKDMYEIRGGLSYKYKYFGIRAGYRAIFVGDENLHGPQIGAYFQW